MHIPLKTYIESIPGFFGIRTEEEPRHEIVHKDDDGFEVRSYVGTVQAQTTVAGNRKEAMDEGFSRLAGYIFGENHGEKTMSMTTPVLHEREQSGRQMEMTTPVLHAKEGNSFVVSFVLPEDVTVESAPKPQDDRIKIVKVEPKMLASLRFTGNPTEEKYEEQSQKLLELVRSHGFVVKSDVMWAQYDQPFAIPFLKRNEALVEVARKN